MQDITPEVGGYLSACGDSQARSSRLSCSPRAWPSRRPRFRFDVHWCTLPIDWRTVLARHAPGLEELGIEAGLLEELGLSSHLPQWLAALDAIDGEQAPRK